MNISVQSQICYFWERKVQRNDPKVWSVLPKRIFSITDVFKEGFSHLTRLSDIKFGIEKLWRSLVGAIIGLKNTNKDCFFKVFLKDEDILIRRDIVF